MNEHERLIKVINDMLGVSESFVTPETSFVDDLGADYCDLLCLISDVEKEFDIHIPDDKIRDMATVKDILSYINYSG